MWQPQRRMFCSNLGISISCNTKSGARCVEHSCNKMSSSDESVYAADKRAAAKIVVRVDSNVIHGAGYSELGALSGDSTDTTKGVKKTQSTMPHRRAACGSDGSGTFPVTYPLRFLATSEAYLRIAIESFIAS